MAGYGSGNGGIREYRRMSVYCREVVCTFHGDVDDNVQKYDRAELEITVTDAGAGPYIVIKTDRWAMDEPAELQAILEKVKKRCFKLFEGGPL